LRKITGAEAALVVNNNAGATLLTLAALAGGKEVVVSRGQLIEIGGSFRLPDVMTSGGAILREVGTTNKTRIHDYRDAINPQTAALMRVHTSNYVIEGFSEAASLGELVQLAHSRNLPLIDDIGSGAVIDFSKYGVADEPVASESIRAGADLVLFSGDKLLGGPQCGIIVGRHALIQRIGKHPLMRALRVDKLILAALAATLRCYADSNLAEQAIPLLQLLSTAEENLKNRAERMAAQIAATSIVEQAVAEADFTYLGGGSVPTQRISTWTVTITPAHGSPDQLAKRLRSLSPAILARIHKDRLVIDLRSVFAHQDSRIVAALAALMPTDSTEDGREGE
ncbi:MAG: L-seryl-tRNA(Sec) selenium transferase, partial [Planctomycetales bacterium]|nr:L-seryl-tRNA(Sec) selenium transferase [Planctomycetales bacterium]